MINRDEGYDFIRAVATVFIVVYHFVLCVQGATGQSAPLIIRIFSNGCCNIGRLGVAWFSILSGSVMWKTYENGIRPWIFYKKRIFRLFIPLWIAYSFFYMASYISNPWMGSVSFYSVISSLFGMDFYYYYFTGSWDLILVGEWYTSIIISLYILFPLMHFLFSRFRKWTTVGMLILFTLNLRLEILTTNGGTWSVINALTFFWLGMLFETYKDKIVSSRFVISLGVLFMGIVFVVFRGGMFGFGYLATFLFAVLSYIVAYSFSSLFVPVYSVVHYLSKLNYEIYLVHHRIQYLLIPVFLNINSNRLAIVFMFITTNAVILLLSEKLSVLSKAAQQKLYGFTSRRK